MLRSMQESMRRSWTLVLYLILGACVVCSGVKKCPVVCSCIWKHGKETAECLRAGLKSVPGGISSSTQVLNLNGNTIWRLPTKCFQRVGLVNLQKIYLSKCQLRDIHSQAFKHLFNLVELDLSHNFLDTVPSDAMSESRLLRKVDLNSNLISKIEEDTFLNLTHLTFLNLSKCQIKVIEPRAFQWLVKLENLYLQYNNLHHLPQDFSHTLAPLHSLELHHNPWVCDCELRSLRLWMINQKIPTAVSPRCDSPPHLKGFSWDSLDLDDFACLPVFTSDEATIYATQGANATLYCQVFSIPKSQLFWTSDKFYEFDTETKKYYTVKKENKGQRVSSTLTFNNVRANSSGSYFCNAENKAGNVSINITLVVQPLELRSLIVLSGSELIGIVIGTLLVGTILFILICFALLHRRQKRINRRRAEASAMRKKDSLKVSLRDEDQTPFQNIGSEEGLSDSTNYTSDGTVSKKPELVNMTNQNRYFNKSLSKSCVNVYDNPLPSFANTLNRPQKDTTLDNFHKRRGHCRRCSLASKPKHYSCSRTWQKRNQQRFLSEQGLYFDEENSSALYEYYVRKNSLDEDCALGYPTYQSERHISRCVQFNLPQHGNHFRNRGSPDEGLGDEQELETDILN
ncbi:leucine-rich repeat, immunoglobulin-like domain and transmembrane domain-containing protein 2 [Tachypleus tridentatus]|uniref:leucine-rich repeat, immunoglobulin-like domain and transmembrane domain-containing protein 2 n=1 Tax=Tachypleus tridentatus TaxID=6853 RepID=UPI003FD3B6D8